MLTLFFELSPLSLKSFSGPSNTSYGDVVLWTRKVTFANSNFELPLLVWNLVRAISLLPFGIVSWHFTDGCLIGYNGRTWFPVRCTPSSVRANQVKGAVLGAIYFPTLLNSRCELPGWRNITPGACSHTSKRFKQISHSPVL